MASLASAGIAALLALSAPGGAAAARLLHQANPLTYVPTGCQNIGFTTTATAGNGVISGSVTLTNPQQYAIPLASVTVQLANNVPVAPIYVTASCPSNSIPDNPQPFQLGSLTCTFSAPLPAGGPASSPSAWTTATPTAQLGMGGAKCSGAAAAIARAPPTPAATCPSPIKLTAQYTADRSAVTGQVVFSNGNMLRSITITNPGVQINNAANPTYSPLQAQLVCPSSTVPGAVLPFFPGTLTCSFYAPLPDGQSWSNFKAAFAKAGLPGSSTVCSSATTAITSPPLYSGSSGSSGSDDDSSNGGFVGGQQPMLGASSP